MKSPHKIALALAALVLAAAGCSGGGNSTRNTAGSGAPAADGSRTFGAAVPDGAPVPVAQLLASPETYDGQTVLVEGAVAEVCQNSGCWLTMVDGDRQMRVRFKDYAFFVPKDCGGRTARVQGVFSIEMTPVDEARHYLEDAGRHDEAMKITEPVQSYAFMASGVRLLK